MVFLDRMERDPLPGGIESQYAVERLGSRQSLTRPCYGSAHRGGHPLPEETGIGVLRSLAPTPLPGYQKWEFTVGDATLALSREEITATIGALLERAGS